MSALEFPNHEHDVIKGQTPGCGAPLALSVGEARLLASMLEPLQPVEPVAYCHLEAEHTGPHYALGQVSDGHWWWLRWDETGEHRELVEAVCCEQVADPEGPGEQDVPCWLPVGHVGAHSFTRPA